MFPLGRIFADALASAPRQALSADGAIDPRPSYVTLDGALANVRTTLVAPSASNNMKRRIIVIECIGKAGGTTVDVDYTDSTGAVTHTFTAAGQVIVLLGTDSGVWKKFT